MLTYKNPKSKPCEVCQNLFIPDRMGQVVCRPACAMKKVRLEKLEERAKVRTRKESIKTIPTLIKEAQHAFNAYIRARDAGKPCICCGKPFEPTKPGGSVDAGHFRSRGAAGHLRFHEDNCFAQRKNCNRPGGTTYAAFRSGVVARIGEGRVVAIESDNAPHKWTHDELRAIRDTYKQKLKEMKA
jgi:hypothetical protein